MNLFEKPSGVKTRWYSPENPHGLPGEGGKTNRGAKGRPYVSIRDGESLTMLDHRGSGTVTRMWVTINDRSPEMLRGLKIECFWDNAAEPAVSCPLGDFFGVGLGRTAAFECALFSNPEGRSFCCFIPMPFRTAARIVVTNASGRDLKHIFYDVDLLINQMHSLEMLYFHALWRSESPNALGKDYLILPEVQGSGRFLGCNIGVVTDPQYGKAWWGEGEVKIRFGDETSPTLCGTGTEDYIGTGWGQGTYCHRSQGCSVGDSQKGEWAFYRYHVDDPVFFDDAISVAIQTIGGSDAGSVRDMQQAGVPLIPISLDSQDFNMKPLMDGPQPFDLSTIDVANTWCNFYRQDSWSSTAYFYCSGPSH